MYIYVYPMTYLLANSIFNVSSLYVKSMTTCKNVYKKCVYKMLQTNGLLIVVYDGETE